MSQFSPGDISEASSPVGASAYRSRNRLSLLLALIAIALITVLVGGILTFSSNTGKTTTATNISTTPLTSGVDTQGVLITRDGKYIAYRTIDEGYQRLFLQQVGQLHAIEILPATKVEIIPMSFSPDGGYIYYLEHEPVESGNQSTLYQMATLGGPPKKVLKSSFFYSSISFSPDGNDFVFARFDNASKSSSLVIASFDGEREREVLSSNSEWLTYPAWSPDGHTIAFARYRIKEKAKNQFVSIEAVDIDSGRIRTLLDERLVNCFRIEWTADGDGIVFGGTRAGDTMSGRRDQVWFAPLGSGKLTRLAPEGSRYVFGGLTADNGAIIAPVNRPSQIWAMDSNGDSRTAEQLTRGTTDGRTGIAPLADGRVGYMTRNGDNWEIWVINSDRSARQVFNANPTVEELRATPDGQYFVFDADVQGNHQLFRLNTDGSDLRQLTYGDEVYTSGSSPSPDGQSVVYTGNSFRSEGANLYRVSIDGGESLPVEGATVRAFTPHYSPDGKSISYVDASVVPARFAVLRTDGGSLSFYGVPDTGTTQTYTGAVWTPDGKNLAYIVHDDKATNVWLQPIDGGPPRQFTDFQSGRIHRIAFSVDGKRLYLARGYAVNDALLVKGFVD